MTELGAEPVTDAHHPPQECPPKERPWLFGLLIAPMAVLSNGIFAGVLSYLFRRQGVGIGRSAEIISLLMLPQTIYFLWSPITDFWMRRRSWLIFGAIAAAITVAISFHGHRLDSRSTVALMFLSACFSQLVVASCGGMMGTLSSVENRRKAGSSYQAGSLAFGALGVFVLAMLAEKMGMGPLGVVAAAMIALPALFALAAPEQARTDKQGLRHTLTGIWHEFKTTFLCWRALPYTLLVIFPMCSGAAMGLLPGIAQDYHVSGHQMAWMNGMAGALLMAAGSLAVTLIPARVRSSVAYLSVGIINAATLSILWLGPLNQSTYFIGTTLYLFTVGSGYALFTGVSLEFLGTSGKSGSGRYSIINSLGNIPVVYMTWLDGKGGRFLGPRGVPGTEAVIGALGAAILLIWFLTRKPADTPVAA